MKLHMLASLAIVLSLTTTRAADDDALAKETKALQGAWTVTSAEKEGEALDRLKGHTLTIKDTTFIIKTQDGNELKGDLRIDPAKKPKVMDWAHQEGLLRNKNWEGIYSLDGDELKICYAEADSKADRPTEFRTTAGSHLMLVVVKREKK